MSRNSRKKATIKRRMRKPYKRITIDIEDVNVYPGEGFTVWLNRNTLDKERDAVQVELRVDSDGTVRLYSHTKSIALADFKYWKPGE